MPGYCPISGENSSGTRIGNERGWASEPRNTAWLPWQKGHGGRNVLWAIWLTPPQPTPASVPPISFQPPAARCSLPSLNPYAVRPLALHFHTRRLLHTLSAFIASHFVLVLSFFHILHIFSFFSSIKTPIRNVLKYNIA